MGHCSLGKSVPHQAKIYTLTQAAAVQLRGTLLPRLQPPNSPAKEDTLTQAVPPYNRAKGGTLTHATLSHQAKIYTLTHAAAVQLRGTLLPRLQCPTQQSSQGGHSNPVYSVPPCNRAKGDTLTRATLSHQAKVYTLTQAPVSHPTVPPRGTL